MKPKLLILVGPTCTGKSTWAKKLAKSNQSIIRVPREEIALLLRGTNFIPEATQQQVECMYETGIISGLSKGFNVIADSYNTTYSELKYYAELFGDHAELYFKLFPGTVEDIAHSLRQRFAMGGEMISQYTVRNQVNDMAYLTHLLKQDTGPYTDWTDSGMYDPSV